MTDNNIICITCNLSSKTIATKMYMIKVSDHISAIFTVNWPTKHILIHMTSVWHNKTWMTRKCPNVTLLIGQNVKYSLSLTCSVMQMWQKIYNIKQSRSIHTLRVNSYVVWRRNGKKQHNSNKWDQLTENHVFHEIWTFPATCAQSELLLTIFLIYITCIFPPSSPL